MTLTTLLKTSEGLQHAVMSKVNAPENLELHLAAWNETTAECKRGWIWEDADVNLKGKIIAHRFGIQQGEKVRVIDNFKLCGLNDTCGLPEKFVLHGVDYVAASLIQALTVAGEDSGIEVLGKTFDLKSAYKQYPLHRVDREHLRIAILDPEAQSPKLYGLNALPFGATGSVAGFLRVSSAVFYVLTVGLRVWCSAFFDDFPTLSSAKLSSGTEQCVSLLFDLLGIDFAREGKKCQPFSAEMKALGLIFDLSQFGNGKVFIRHTNERRAELLERISNIPNDNKLTPKEAESLRGRVQWYESYLFGRIANLAVHRIGKRAITRQSPKGFALDDELRAALTFMRLRIEKGVPLELSASTERAMLVFTDGTCNEEGLSGTVGGILCDHDGTPLYYFSEHVPSLIMDPFREEANNPIYLVELLACYIAAYLWSGMTACRYLVAYIDNEASRAALIKAYSSTKLGNALVRMFIDLEDGAQWKVWFGRVSSYSNPSDAPSRFLVEDIESKGAVKSPVAWDRVILSFERTIREL